MNPLRAAVSSRSSSLARLAKGPYVSVVVSQTKGRPPTSLTLSATALAYTGRRYALLFHSPQCTLIATTSPGEMSLSRPAASKTVTVFAIKLVSAESLLASIK